MSGRKKLNAFGMASVVKHIRIPNWLMDKPAWQALPLGARCLLLEVWRRHNGQNNGQISYSNREAVKDLQCSPNTAVRWFRELQEKGFLVAVKRGSFSWKDGARDGRATEWRLTMEPCKGEHPTKEFASWGQRKKESTATVTEPYGTHDNSKPLPANPSNSLDGTRHNNRQGTNSTLNGTHDNSTYSLPGRGGSDWLFPPQGKSHVA